ncbi:MAG: ECF transporter S component [Clostridia bacterium]|nr:ECF transporter S component [Clostridia bacterium]
MQHAAIRRLVMYALFSAMILLLGLTPLGFIRLPIASIVTVHIPVVIGAMMLGVKGGAFLGFIFGLTSLINCFIAPDAIAAICLGQAGSFGLYNLFLIVIVLFVPRVLVGVFSALVFKLVSKIDKTRLFSIGASAVVGSLTNTIFLLGALALFAFEPACAAFGVSGASGLFAAILGVISLNGVLEAVAAVVICLPIAKALLFYDEKYGIKDIRTNDTTTE